MEWINGSKAPWTEGGGSGARQRDGPRGTEEERRAWADLIKVGVQCKCVPLAPARAGAGWPGRRAASPKAGCREISADPSPSSPPPRPCILPPRASRGLRLRRAGGGGGSLKQLLDDGFFHADPHSGNLLKTADGDLAYLDFGMMSELSQPRRFELIAAIVHLINRDYALLARDFQARPPPRPAPPPPPPARLPARLPALRRAGRGVGPPVLDFIPDPRPPPPPSRTKWTRRVPHPVLIGHAASLQVLDFIPEDFEDLDAMAAELEKAPAPPSRVPPRGVRGAPLCPPARRARRRAAEARRAAAGIWERVGRREARVHQLRAARGQPRGHRLPLPVSHSRVRSPPRGLSRRVARAHSHAAGEPGLADPLRL